MAVAPQVGPQTSSSCITRACVRDSWFSGLPRPIDSETPGLGQQRAVYQCPDGPVRALMSEEQCML